MDIQMPIMGGYEAASIIKNDIRFRELPIIAMTAHAMSDAKELCIKAGMDDYLSKPIDQDKLFSILTKWIKPRITKSKANYQILHQTEPEQKGGSDVDLPETLTGIDIGSALKRLNGNKKLYKQLLLDFAKNNASVIKEIKELLDIGDFKTAERIAHTLKGVGGNLSAGGVFVAARDLENALTRKDDAPKDGDYDILVSNLSQAIEPVLEGLQSLLKMKAIQDNNKKELQQNLPIDLEQATLIMIQLARLIENNSASSLEVFESFKDIMGNSIYKEAILEMENYIDNFNFVSALPILKKIAEDINISLK